MKRSLFVYIFCGIFFILNISSIDYGSYTTVGNFGSLSLADGDRLLGFSSFVGDLTITNSFDVVTWDCYYPLIGSFTFNGGTLELQENVNIASESTFFDGGTLVGNGQTVHFSPSEATRSLTGPFVLDNVALIFESAVSLTGTFEFKNNCKIIGRESTIDFSAATVIVSDDAQLWLKDLTVDGIGDGTLYCSGSSSQLVLESVELIQDGNYSFIAGFLDIVGQIKMRGGYGFSYESDQQCIIHRNSELFFDSGMTFSYNTSASDLVVMEDFTSTLYLYETTLFSAVPGLHLTKGIFTVDGECPVYSGASVENEGIQLGDGTRVNNVKYNPLPESGLSIRSGYVVYENV